MTNPILLGDAARRRAHWSRRALVLAALLSSACQGGFEDSGAATGGVGAGGASGLGGAAAGGGAGRPSADPTGLPYTTRIARLTHTQYDNTVKDLLFIEAAPSASFQPDPVFGGYDNSADNLAVADRLGRDYRRAAEELAERAVTTPAAYARLVTCAATSAACAGTFVDEFGARAYRRPLTAAERTLFLGLHARGAELVGSGDAFRDGVRLVIEAMLQSPSFLYRPELTREPAPEGGLKLDPHEVAQRLSYMLWNTMPDAALFAAARSGELGTAEGVAAQAARMLEDTRAEGPVADFHSQWLELSRYEDLTRSPELFPGFSPTLPMQAETLAFVRHVVFDLERGYESLLSAPFSFVDAGLARLYGLPGTFGTELVKTELDPAVRRGLLTQIGFLASHAYPTETSPIHRGVFVHRRILCNDIPNPPPNIDTSEGRVENPRTTREGVEIQTSRPACVTCHSQINPPGFAFEHFDAVGRVRTTDRGQPVDTSGQMTIDGTTVAFENATDMIAAIAKSRAGRSCYARNILRYSYGRAEVASDQPTIDELADAMASDSVGVKAALRTLTQTRSFRARAPNQD